MSEYHFIGGDDKEYGPYSADQIKKFIAENRLNSNTSVKTTGGEWKPASTYPELMSPKGPVTSPPQQKDISAPSHTSEYHFIGGDNKEYGPFSAEQIKRFMAENRLSANTSIKTTGGEWKLASTYPELGFTSPPTGTPMAGQHQQAINAQAAQQKINGPAIFMMVMAIIGIVGNIFNLGLSVFGTGLMGAAAGSSGGGMSDAQQFEMIANLVGGVGGAIIGLIIQGLILFGSIKMKNLQSYGLSITAAILSITCNCCCPIGWGAGIWALVVLVDPKVKAAFN
ncbi:MAG TPA: hypothetical protein DEB48_05495 [Verrucomicrobiales bacterium]|nr:hypothetical protein [Verrucomicrobiales bacterium]|tara:strand:- start:33 stop:878 length:846 start_codon:yes stop_codon:yes gene_type:complete